MTTITARQFTEAMRAAVAERGEDWVYPANDQVAYDTGWRDSSGLCQYTTLDGEPGCIIGLALHKIDPSIVPAYGTWAGASLILRGFGLPGSVLIAAQVAQAAQDNGKSWGEALARYERELEERRLAA
jgi:hypothetical protein